MRKITEKDIGRWKTNTVELAPKLGYEKILSRINNVKFYLCPGFPPVGNWYGSFIYPEIRVYECNLSTEYLNKSDSDIIKKELKKKGMPETDIDEIMRMLCSVSPEDFFEVYNQSGMDHEIGHLYNYIAGRANDDEEKAASKFQIEFAKERNTNAWKCIRKIMPKVLAYHKNIGKLK